MDQKHKNLVANMSKQVEAFYALKRPFHIYHGSTNSTRILTFKRGEFIDISSLNRVLTVNSTTHTVIVEANVPMDALVRATMKDGFVPPVVMEFPGITVGGGIQGGAGESGSFRWGCFNQICNWYEMILADGRVIKASPVENADLFYGTAGSFGTLGIITAAEIQLVPAMKYVNITYTSTRSFTEAVEMLTNESANNHDYIDGIMFASNRGVIMTGSLSNTKNGLVRHFSRAHDQWFYLHAETKARNGAPVIESIPLRDYLFRYDRGGFWVGRLGFDKFNVAYNRLSRWVFNPVMHARKLYQALQASGASQNYIVQDLALPVKTASKFMEFIDTNYHIYPLWLCPLKTDSMSPFQSNNLDTPVVINVGVWGGWTENYDRFIAINRSIETKVHELSGKKWFYAHSYYTQKEFWQIYPKAVYDTLRQKYVATSLPTVFDKVTVKKRYKLNLRRGSLKAILGRAKLRIED